MVEQKQPEGIVLNEAQLRSRRRRSIAIAWALGILVILFFAVTPGQRAAVLVRPI